MQTDLQQFTTFLGDDALILGQRLSEWCSKAHSLEEDLALSNVALDFIGRAQMFFNYAAELSNEETTADNIAFLRPEREYRNTLIHELPINDFAYTIVRQFFVDNFNVLYLNALSQSHDPRLVEIAHKCIKESDYHLRRSADWVVRLGDGTEESKRRMQNAIEELWLYVNELFIMSDSEIRLLEQGISVDKRALYTPWLQQVNNTFTEATLTVPETNEGIKGGRDGLHTEHLGPLLCELQYMQRTYPNCKW